MTRDALYNSILGLKNELLRCNLTYINRRSIGSIISADRMFEILIIVQEATKLVKTFKSSYNGL